MFSQFAQGTQLNGPSETLPGGPIGSSTGGITTIVLYLSIIVISIVGLWKLFTKAGQPGWAAIIPIYNSYVLLKIAGKPGWWVILTFIPFVNLVVSIIVGTEVAKRFGFSSAFGAIVCGLLGIGYLIIGFGSHAYSGAATTA